MTRNDYKNGSSAAVAPPEAQFTASQTESTVSANVKLVGQNGADIMLTVRTGATINDVIGVLDTMAQGLIVAKDRYHLSPAPARNGRAAASSDAPTCPRHGRPMKPSKHHGGFYCPAKIADDDGTGKPVYCKQKSK